MLPFCLAEGATSIRSPLPATLSKATLPAAEGVGESSKSAAVAEEMSVPVPEATRQTTGSGSSKRFDAPEKSCDSASLDNYVSIKICDR